MFFSVGDGDTLVSQRIEIQVWPRPQLHTDIRRKTIMSQRSLWRVFKKDNKVTYNGRLDLLVKNMEWSTDIGLDIKLLNYDPDEFDRQQVILSQRTRSDSRFKNLTPALNYSYTLTGKDKTAEIKYNPSLKRGKYYLLAAPYIPGTDIVGDTVNIPLLVQDRFPVYYQFGYWNQDFIRQDPLTGFNISHFHTLYAGLDVYLWDGLKITGIGISPNLGIDLLPSEELPIETWGLVFGAYYDNLINKIVSNKGNRDYHYTKFPFDVILGGQLDIRIHNDLEKIKSNKFLGIMYGIRFQPFLNTFPVFCKIAISANWGIQESRGLNHSGVQLGLSFPFSY